MKEKKKTFLCVLSLSVCVSSKIKTKTKQPKFFSMINNIHPNDELKY